MTLWEILETLIIGPLKLVFEWIFQYANHVVGHPGWAIVVLSIIMNILLLPLYRRADIMQKNAQETEARLRDGVAHIKKTFTGDERMMILQTYYRQNQYKPTDALKGSISLLLEIPFFMAAYQFLSGLDIFENVSFGPIANLGAPDGLLAIGSIAVNVLPILMTIINIISSTIYLKGATAKAKVQLYAMALLFLVLLYNSPACLVFYWTLNNVFSLGKNIVLIVLSNSKLFQKEKKNSCKKSVPQPNDKVFLYGMFFITLLTGVLIPSVYIAASPQEYVNITYFFNPLWYIVSSFCYAAGMFLIWMNVFYRLATARGKVIMETFFWICCGNMLVNYMFFGRKLGIISSNLKYEQIFKFSGEEMLLNLITTCILSVILYYIIVNWKNVAKNVLLVACISLTTMVVINVVTIKSSIDELVFEDGTVEAMPRFQLSKEGKNVVVIMLDRAINVYVPYIFNEKPELKEQFEGFTYYSNTISFGQNTNFGTPALLGGYEYTPVELNKRDTETLVSKQNEALKVMPVIFMENGYEVTVCDPPYANYQWIPDLSIYDDYPEINAYITQGKFVDDAQKESIIQTNKRNFFCFGLMKSMPVDWQSGIYDHGNYNRMRKKTDIDYSIQKYYSNSTAEGISYNFMESYNVLVNMANMTTINSDDSNTFLFMANRTTHEPMLLQEPEYVPVLEVNNIAYDMEHSDRFMLNGQSIEMISEIQMKHYHINTAALIQLGKWFDYLRENDVYDNTRIILVADHGENCQHLEELIFDKGTENEYDGGTNCPLFMVKDFDSQEFTTSTEFMTNADVPTLAMESLIDNPRNPFTQKEITSDEKYAHEQYIIISNIWDTEINNGNTFLPARWASVKDNVWDANNWEFSEEEVILKEHKLP